MSEEQAVYIWAHDSDKVPELTCQQEIYGLVTGGGQQGSSTSSMLSGYKKDSRLRQRESAMSYRAEISKIAMLR